MKIPQKMTDAQVEEARVSAASGESDESIAARYDVSPLYIRQIREGRCRKRAGGPITRTSTLTRRVEKLERRLARLEKKLV